MLMDWLYVYVTTVEILRLTASCQYLRQYWKILTLQSTWVQIFTFYRVKHYDMDKPLEHVVFLATV